MDASSILRLQRRSVTLSFSNKRDVDLGLNRALNSLQEVNNVLGQSAANYVESPGRRRRSEQP